MANRGYRNIKPRRAAPVPALHPGDKHVFRAEMDKDDLRVFVDDREMWEGRLGPDAEALTGPVGIRSDNARLLLDLRAGVLSGVHSNNVGTCKSGPDATD